MIEEAEGGREHDLNLLAAYVEGRLAGSERERFVAHLAGCADCRITLAALARDRAASGSALRLDAESRREIPLARRLAQVPHAAWLPLAAVLVLATATSYSLLREPVSAPHTVATPAAAVSHALPRASVTPTPNTATSPSLPIRSGDERLLVKRGGSTRTVAGKTFRLKAGEWTDASFDPEAGLPVIEVSGAGELADLLGRLPALGSFAALGGRVLVVWKGTVYRFRPLEPQ